MLDVLNTIKFLSLAELEVGQHFYWELGNLKIHGQIILTSWFVIALILLAAILASRNVERIPSGIQNFMESVLEFLRSLTKDQIGEKDYRPWVPFVGTLFLFIFVSNWSGALVPWKVIDFTKPLSLSFRLFGNILADELVVGVLVLLVPLFIPLPMMVLGLFLSAIQALIFATLAANYIGEALEEHGAENHD